MGTSRDLQVPSLATPLNPNYAPKQRGRGLHRYHNDQGHAELQRHRAVGTPRDLQVPLRNRGGVLSVRHPALQTEVRQLVLRRIPGTRVGVGTGESRHLCMDPGTSKYGSSHI